MTTYKVVRFVFNGKTTTVRGQTHLTEEEAQAYCRDPETSGKTATGAAAARITRRLGTCQWFCGYQEE